jgi:archaemetzincin
MQARDSLGNGEAFRLLGVGKVDAALLNWLALELPKIFSAVRMQVEQRLGFDLGRYYDRARKQYSAEAILDALAPTPRGTRMLAVVDADLYVPDLNFVFGLAQPRARRAIIQLPRLREGFYGKPENDELFRTRVLKEAVHELGHTCGLGHCPNPRCVMHFSNRLEDTDSKSAHFCPSCTA